MRLRESPVEYYVLLLEELSNCVNLLSINILMLSLSPLIYFAFDDFNDPSDTAMISVFFHIF